jgi:hypothetical protein
MARKPTPIEHGTLSGYKKHSHRKDPKCQPCWDARARHERDIRPKKRKPKLSEEELERRRKERYQRDKEKISKAHREYYLSNKHKIDERKKLWRQSNVERSRNNQRKYYQKNREHIRNNLKRRRHTRYGVLSIPYSKEEVLLTYGTDCHICNLPIDIEMSRKPGIPGWQKALHIDHVIPMSKGGSDTLDNVRPSHAYCNLSKGSKTNI